MSRKTKRQIPATVHLTDIDGRVWILVPCALRSEYHPITRYERFHTIPATPFDEGSYLCTRDGVSWTHVLNRNERDSTWTLYKRRGTGADTELNKSAFGENSYRNRRDALARL